MHTFRNHWLIHSVHIRQGLPTIHISQGGRPSLEQRPARCWQEGAPARTEHPPRTFLAVHEADRLNHLVHRSRHICPSSPSSWRRGCHLRPSRPRRSNSSSTTRSDIVQVRAEVLVRLPGVAVGAVALPEARKHVPVADAAVGAHPLQHNLLVQDSPLPYLRNVWWHCARSAKSVVSQI